MIKIILALLIILSQGCTDNRVRIKPEKLKVDYNSEYNQEIRDIVIYQLQGRQHGKRDIS